MAGAFLFVSLSIDSVAEAELPQAGPESVQLLPRISMVSKTSIRDILQKIRPKTWVGRVTAYAAALYVIFRLVGWARGRAVFGTGVVGVILFVGAVLLGFRLLGRLRRLILWRLRNRLLVTYVFIAVVPVVLIVAMVVVSGYLMFGQLGAYLLISDLQAKVDEIDAANRALLSDLEGHVRSGERLGEAVQHIIPKGLAELVAGVPGLAFRAELGREGYSTYEAGISRAAASPLPQWARGGFSGIVRDSDGLHFRSVRVAVIPQGNLTLSLSALLNDEVFSHLRHQVGPAELRATTEVLQRTPGETSLVLNVGNRRLYVAGVLASARLAVPPPANRLDMALRGASKFDVYEWVPGETAKTVPVIILFASRPSVLIAQLLSTLGEVRSLLVVILVAVGIVFLVMEILALVAGVVLTRTVTKAVAGLYEGTQRVQAGDLSYRIKTTTKDQLGVLGDSFNNMTESIARLIEEVREKQRLEGEVEIARQVQAQLFPQEAPQVGSLELAGACRPARRVSGDYYDYFRIGEHRLGLAIGDISGKGISAALLMATIQSALRSYVSTDGAGSVDTSQLAERLNRQLFESTSPEKYATFCCAIFDSPTGLLTYTNAGHLPPLHCWDGKMERLEAGGTVVGLFEHASYQQGTVQLNRGSLLVAYTDGITECENAYGEAFGEERLAAIVRQHSGKFPEALIAEIMRQVDEWTAGAEQDDDMTLLVAKLH